MANTQFGKMDKKNKSTKARCELYVLTVLQEVIGLKYVESIGIKDNTSLQIKFNKKEAAKDPNIQYVIHSAFPYLRRFLPSCHKPVFSFATPVRCREVLEGLEYLSKIDDDATGLTLTDEGLKKVRNKPNHD